MSYNGNLVLNCEKKKSHLLIRQNISDGFITEANQEAAQLLFTEYFFGIPLEMSPTKSKLSENSPKRLQRQHPNVKRDSLSGDKTQEPLGEEAIVDDQRQLSVNKPLCCQLPESSLAPFSLRLRQSFSLLHLLLALRVKEPMKTADGHFPK